MNKTPHTEHTFTNYRKLISLANHDWETAEAGKISGLNVETACSISTGEHFIISVRRLYLDDSHALSAVGTFGAGLVRPRLHALDDDCLIVASLAKSFGASGGLVMLGSERQKKLIQRYGGPSNWSQSLNSAAIGAGRASIQLHRTLEFAALQEKLQVNIRLFDSLVRTEQHNSNMAIRLVNCGKAELANSIAIELANQGFFTSAVFFPVVPQGKAAIRVTLRADMETTRIHHFCELISELLRTHGRDIGS
jgi:7-keto-8-aminopelargonate synthetase-like enzyme